MLKDAKAKYFIILKMRTKGGRESKIEIKEAGGKGTGDFQALI